MSTTTHMPKRRRVDDAQLTLSKPFKSPFKSPLNSSVKPDIKSGQKEPPQSIENAHAMTVSLGDSTPTTSKVVLNQTSPPKLNVQSSLGRHIRPLPSVQASFNKSTPEILILQKQHTQFLTTLAGLRASLETNSQALRLESLSRDADLERLIAVWKGASRAAAEEIFGNVKDRVNRMGGVSGWQEKERERGMRDSNMGFGSPWGVVQEGKWTGGGCENDGDNDEERRDRGDGEVEGGCEESERLKRDGPEGGNAEDQTQKGSGKIPPDIDENAGFTMDMMLKCLNIELDVIGYDKEGQTWMD
ncbi:hypothetical protein MMC09_004607 [Bachmanniomyces sp. S44760]|nr:hypothetical protein [Bachmanniomyces sp. S44760]